MFIYQFMGGVVDTITIGEDEVEYEPYRHRKIEKPTSYAETMMHLLKGSLGAGILAMPDAFGRVGIIGGIIGIIIMGVIATYCIHMLIKAQYNLCKKMKVGYMAYPKSMRTALQSGPPCLRRCAYCLGRFVDIVLISWQLGLCCVYVVFVAENIKQVCDYYGSEYSIRIHILFILLPTLIVNMVKDLKLLTPVSSISNFVTMMGLILTFFYLIEDDVVLDTEKLKPKGFMEVPVFIGITLFALEAVGVILALEYNMERPQDFLGLFGLFNFGMAIILLLYMLVGVFGYLKYGSEIQASITLNLPKQEKKAQAAKLTFALAIFLSMPLQNFVAYNIVWQKVKKRSRPSRHRLYDYMVRFILVIIPWLMAMALPKLGPFISLVGAFCLSLLAIVFPATVDLCLWYPDQYGTFHYKLLRDMLIIIFGMFCLVSGCYTSILEVIAGH